MGVDTDFIHLESGMTRINVKLKADCESEINGQGPAIGKEHLQQLFDKLQKLQEGRAGPGRQHPRQPAQRHL